MSHRLRPVHPALFTSAACVLLMLCITGSSIRELMALAPSDNEPTSSLSSPMGPRFTSEMPSQVTFTPDRGVTIDCPIQGHPKPEITWFILSSQGNGASAAATMWSTVTSVPHLLAVSPSNGTLSLLPFRRDQFRPDVHSASFKCSAHNAQGRIVSTPVRIVAGPFEASVEIARKVRRGGTAVLRCSVPELARDHVTVTSWIRDDRYDIFLGQDGRHVMLPNGELHILTVRQDDEAHFYHCRFLVRPSGKTLTSSTPGRVYVQSESAVVKTAPIIVDSVNRVVAWRGQDAVLPCIGEGSPQPRVKWYKSQKVNGAGLLMPILPQSIGAGGNTGSRYRTVGGTLIIHAVTAEDQGRFVCLLNNTSGSAEANVELVFRDHLQARISVDFGPSSSANSVVVVDAQTPVILSCFVSGSPRPAATWIKDGQRYSGNGRVLADEPDPGGARLHLPSMSKEDQGMYQCLANNQEGDWVQATVQLAVGALPPQFVKEQQQQKQQQILQHPGSLVSLKCVAFGTPPPHFTWTLDNQPLPSSERVFLGQQMGSIEDQVVSVLNISHIRVQDGGNYKCSAENRVGKVEHSVVLNVYGPPVVKAMGNVVAVGGKRIELVCPVAGYPIEGISWEKDGRRLVIPANGRHRLTQQLNGSLVIDPVDRSTDPGIYTCEARGQGDNLARQSLQFTVVDPPHVMPMSDSSPTFGERLALQCAVIRGGLPLSIVWLRNDVPVNPDSSVGEGISVKSINDFTSSLTVESLDVHHAGTYSCLARNSGGVAQAIARVTVQVGPRIAAFSTPRSVTVGSRVQLSCVIEEGDPPLSIHWLRNHRPLPASGNNGIKVTDFNAYSSILTVDSVTMEHDGNYTCRAENRAGFALHSALLRVSVPPVWLNQHPPVEVVRTVRGHGVELVCPVGGVPSPLVVWSFSKDKRAEKYLNVFNGNRTLLFNQSLTISPVELFDQGFYQCEASNGIGRSLSAVIALYVHSPPQVELIQDRATVRKGFNTVLKCTATGDQPLSVQWRKDSAPIDPGGQHSSRITTKNFDNNFSELAISNANLGDEGLYECLASNIYGEDSDSVFVQIQDVPQAPQELKVTSVSSRRLQLEWKAPLSDGGNSLYEFIVAYQSPGGEVQTMKVTADRFAAVVDNLMPATSYHLSMRAVNALGQSQPSTGLSVTTEEEAPEAPIKVSASNIQPKSFVLSWSPPTHSNGVLLSYQLTIDSGRATVNRTSLPGTVTEHRLSGLSPNVNHVIQLSAVNSQGSGPPSAPLTVKTAEDVPAGPPLNVACVALDSRSLQITWLPPMAELRNGIVRLYRIYYELVDDGDDNSLLVLDQTGEKQSQTSELTNFLSGLEKYSNYRIQVSAATSAGEGIRSAPLTCLTREDAPEAPYRIKVALSGPDSLLITWLMPPGSGRNVVHYNVYAQQEQPQKWTAINVPWLEIRNLKARRTVFNFQVSAVSRQAGEGTKSTPVSFTYTPTNKVPASVVSIGREIQTTQLSRLMLPCAALGDNPLQVTWYRDGRPLSEALHVSSTNTAVVVQPWIERLQQQHSLAIAQQEVAVLANGSLFIERPSQGANWTCMTRNRNGQDSVSYGLTVVIPPQKPQLRLVASNRSSISVRWTSSASANPSKVTQSSVRSYYLRYKLRSDDEEAWTDVTVTGGAFFLSGLNCGSEYELVLVATSRAGNSSSDPLVAKTRGSSPQPGSSSPDEVAVAAHSVNVDLSRWLDGGCPVQQFLIRFRTAESGDWVIAGAESPPLQQNGQFLLGGLLPATSYVLRISATNQAGTTHREYAIQTLSQPDHKGRPAIDSGHHQHHLALLLSDPRVAVPIGISSLAILLTVVTLVLRCHYRAASQPSPANVILPNQPFPPQPNCSYDEDTLNSTLGRRNLQQKRNDCDLLYDHDDHVSPYAVFMPGAKLSSGRMKTFAAEHQGTLELNNYAAPVEADEEPAYDYIAPAQQSGSLVPHRHHRSLGKLGTAAINPQAVFIPIAPARSGTWNRQHARQQQQQSTFDWNNQETLVLSHRL